MKLENVNCVPATITESTNSILTVPDNNTNSLTKQKFEVKFEVKWITSVSFVQVSLKV